MPLVGSRDIQRRKLRVKIQDVCYIVCRHPKHLKEYRLQINMMVGQVITVIIYSLLRK